MIISASRRTDLPSFHAEWFIRQVRAAFCEVPNPRFPGQKSRISLAADDVDCFVFWTRNPAPLFPFLPELDDGEYPYYFLYTVVDYPPLIEPAAGPLCKRIAVFKQLAARIGPGRVVWRYDPVILTGELGFSYHAERFRHIAEALRGCTDTVIVSFFDSYAKAEKRLRQAGIQRLDPRSAANAGAAAAFLARLADTARENGMGIRSCSETFETEAAGVPRGSCIDAERIKREFGISVTAHKDRGQRKLCRCGKSRDIGSYNTCPRGCLYCYAS